MTLDEILALSDIGQKINYLKNGRKTPLPNVDKLHAMWDPSQHEIIVDKEKYPKIKITTNKEKKFTDPTTGKEYIEPAQTKEVEPNRIALPIEQDIVNIQTAFTVGEEPKINCEPDGKNEETVLLVLKKILAKNKIKYQNKKIVRSWLSEQDVAEYWYAVKDDGFWAKLKRKVAGIFGSSSPEYRLKSMVWSPFRGDKLYPFHNDDGDLVAVSREYKKKKDDGAYVTCFMTVTDTMVYQWDLDSEYTERPSFKHGFVKIPVLYGYNQESYCEKIQTLRVRLEKLLSSYADCIDYHFFPILMLFGDVENVSGEFRNRMVELTGQGANAAYLTWNQVPDTVKFEADTLINMIYDMTDTPRISFEQLRGTGNALSGVAFRYVFMDAHMAVSNHAEVIGDFFQRRNNFLVSAIGSLNPSLKDASETIDAEVEIQPYMIDSLADNVKIAVEAKNGGVWSQRHGIMFAGNIDRVDEELKQIREEQENKQLIQPADSTKQ